MSFTLYTSLHQQIIVVHRHNNIHATITTNNKTPTGREHRQMSKILQSKIYTYHHFINNHLILSCNCHSTKPLLHSLITLLQLSSSLLQRGYALQCYSLEIFFNCENFEYLNNLNIFGITHLLFVFIIKLLSDKQKAASENITAWIENINMKYFPIENISNYDWHFPL